MRSAFIILLIHIGLASFGQEIIQENDSLILWSKNRPLTWDDFKGPPTPVRTHNRAGTGMTIQYISMKNIYGQVEINPLCYFQKCRSWTNTNDSKTLDHEQLHFDIQELYTRKLRKSYSEYGGGNFNDQDFYTSTSDSIYNLCQSMQEKYDYEVLVNYPKFLEWKSRISEELDELKEYEYTKDKSLTKFK